MTKSSDPPRVATDAAAAIEPADQSTASTADAQARPGDRRFELEIQLPAPCDAVWRALTEAREIQRWFATSVVCDERVDGRLDWSWDDHYHWPQTIEVFEPKAHLRTRYDSSVADPAGGRRPLFVDFRLEGEGGVTTLRLCHFGFGPEADFDAEYDGISGGWPAELRSLRLYLERHVGQDRAVAWAKCRVAIPRAEAWQRLVGPAGFDCMALTTLREGEPFALDASDSLHLEGETLFVPHEREFTGRVSNLGDAWLRLSAEEWGGTTNVWVWLALYSQPESVAAAYRVAFEAMLLRLFPAVAGSDATS